MSPIISYTNEISSMTQFVKSFQTRKETLLCFRLMSESRLFILQDKLECLLEADPTIPETRRILDSLEIVINEI